MPITRKDASFTSSGFGFINEPVNEPFTVVVVDFGVVLHTEMDIAKYSGMFE
jgi:hypothetical protein